MRYARYVVQWDVAEEPSLGANAAGDYRERYESWLADVRALRLTAVLALTSYDGAYPADAGRYEHALRGALALAANAGAPVRYVEAWNEPNDQGREPPAPAADFANVAAAVCGSACTVIAGDLEDAPGMARYAAAYERALDFAPAAWGIHPYRALAHRDVAGLRATLATVPAGARLWVTEIAAFYCRQGRLRGEAAQAREAAYLVGRLLPAVPVAHAFYYGIEPAFGRSASCREDTDLFAADGQPRAAAGIVFPPSADGRWPLLGPAPGQQPLSFAWLGE